MFENLLIFFVTKIQELVNKFNFHNYDNLKHTAQKLDPCRRASDVHGHEVMSLLFAGYNGDLDGLQR